MNRISWCTQEEAEYHPDQFNLITSSGLWGILLLQEPELREKGEVRASAGGRHRFVNINRARAAFDMTGIISTRAAVVRSRTADG